MGDRRLRLGPERFSPGPRGSVRGDLAPGGEKVVETGSTACGPARGKPPSQPGSNSHRGSPGLGRIHYPGGPVFTFDRLARAFRVHQRDQTHVYLACIMDNLDGWRADRKRAEAS